MIYTNEEEYICSQCGTHLSPEDTDMVIFSDRGRVVDQFFCDEECLESWLNHE